MGQDGTERPHTPLRECWCKGWHTHTSVTSSLLISFSTLALWFFFFVYSDDRGRMKPRRNRTMELGQGDEGGIPCAIPLYPHSPWVCLTGRDERESCAALGQCFSSAKLVQHWAASPKAESVCSLPQEFCIDPISSLTVLLSELGNQKHLKLMCHWKQIYSSWHRVDSKPDFDSYPSVCCFPQVVLLL